MNRLRKLAVLLGAAALLLVAVLPVASAAAASPWWQVLTGSRPTNLWEPQSQIQEINAPSTPFALLVGGNVVGFFNLPPIGPEATAANVQTALEGAYGAGDVDVTGGPGGSAPLIVTSVGADAGRFVPPIETLGPEATAKMLQAGGSGRLVLTITNLGNAPVDGSASPVTIVDELPEGVEASGYEAYAGVFNRSGPVNCTIDTPSRVSCSFAGTLPSYEAIEIEIFATLVGDPPAAGAPGRVTVAGGNAPPAAAAQQVVVSPEKTPFGFEHFSTRIEAEGGGDELAAGSHPFQVTNTIAFKAGPMKPAGTRRDSSVEQPAQPRNLRFSLPAGLVGNASAVTKCSMADFYGDEVRNLCPDSSAVGAASATLVEPEFLGFGRLAVPVFNLTPAKGEPARFGFTAVGVPILIDTEVDPDNEYRIIASVRNASQASRILSSTVALWGAPGDPRHDSTRGWNCVYRLQDLGPCARPAGLADAAFLRQPVSCSSPLVFGAEAEPWNVPPGGLVDRASSSAGPLVGCNQVPFDPSIAAAPSSRLASSASGLDFRLEMPNAGLLNRAAIAEGQAKKVEVTLPEGMTINPSQGEGLAACAPDQYARETASSRPGEGCPDAAKIGEVQISTPLLEEEAHGSLYVASPFDNPFGSLVAVYLVARIPERGIVVKQAGRVEPDPVTGRLVTTFDDLPQIPFDTFKLHFHEGGRAPLVTPPACGTYEVVARFTPWSATDPDNPLPSEIVSRTSAFTVNRGVGGGACPSGPPPFRPALSAGTVNNSAGSYSPFDLRLTRGDGEQEFTRFSVELPPGLTGKLAGIPFCPDAAIDAARARTGPRGGQEEIEQPSCPAASQLGRTLVGAGVGASLSYVPGKVYLAGPYAGASLSIVSITAAKVGPFDLGTVVIRMGLKVDPETAEVVVDPAGSDPIPHIVKGIVVHTRDIRVYADRPEFMLNPTSCARDATASTVTGAGLDPRSPADDQAVTVSAPFQAADCASLGFKPKLALSLRGGTKRGDTPRFKAVLTARGRDANIGAARVTLPHSEFLEQAHIRTICTRVQFAAGGGNGERCPAASVYGRARAVTPLLDEPLVGPVFLRASSRKLPDLVAALHSPRVDINLAGHIDSVNGRIRNTFEAVPDAPVTKFTFEMQGGRKGLLVNSTDLCKRKHRASVSFTGQNGKRLLLNPVLSAPCGKAAKKKGGKGRGAR